MTSGQDGCAYMHPAFVAMCLPDDVLVEILEISRLNHQASRIWSDSCSIGFRFGAVSRQFRRVVMSIPAFWRKVVVRGEGNDRTYRRMLACLLSSGNTPLEVVYTLRDGQPDNGLRFFTAIAEHAPRLEKLHFSYSIASERLTMCEVFRHLFVPELSSFVIHIDQSFYYDEVNNSLNQDVSTPPKIPLFTAGAPKLAEIRYIGIGYSFTTVPLSNLRKITIESPFHMVVDTIDDLRQLLLDATALKVLHVFGELWERALPRSMTDWIGPRYTGGIISELKVDSQTKWVLEAFQMDQLSHLILEDIHMPDFVGFLSRSSPPPFLHVARLELHNTRNFTKQDQILTLMENTPNVQDLALVGVGAWHILDAMLQFPHAWTHVNSMEFQLLEKDIIMDLVQARRHCSPIEHLFLPQAFVSGIVEVCPEGIDQLQEMGVDIGTRTSHISCAPRPWYKTRDWETWASESEDWEMA